MNTKDQFALLEKIVEFIGRTPGLEVAILDDGNIDIVQKTDERRIKFHKDLLGDVLDRTDKDGKSFIQVNFMNGRKILLTDALVGFKPEPRTSLDITRLPKVVTTPDLLSVFEAIEEVLNAEAFNPEEIDVLREVYHSILQGGEAVGFDLKPERMWLGRILSSAVRASA